MVISIVRTGWEGPGAFGGGVTTLVFNNASTDAQACVDAVEDFWDEILLAVSNTMVATIESTVSTYDETTGALEAVTPVTSPGAQPGQDTNTMLPPTSQGLIRWTTATVVNNRILRGRTFIPGMVELNNQNGGIPTSGLVTLFNSAATQLVDDATADLVVWHRPPPLISDGGEIGDVVAGACWDQWAVLRSRRD